MHRRLRPAAQVVVTLAVALASLAGCAGPGADDAGRPEQRLVDVGSWAFALGVDLDDPEVAAWLGRHDLVVVDGEEVDAALVDRLQQGGTLVIGYLSVGTIEPDRPWTERLAAHRLELWEDWGEWYADVDDAQFRSIVVDEIAAEVLERGVDGLFLDNVAMVEHHPEQADGMAVLVASLDALVDERDGLLFAQNGESVLGDDVLDHLDGWNREDLSWTPDGHGGYVAVPDDQVASGVAAIRAMADRGLFVTVTDYVATSDVEAADAAAATACAAGALPYVADRDLTRRPPPRICP